MNESPEQEPWQPQSPPPANPFEQAAVEEPAIQPVLSPPPVPPIPSLGNPMAPPPPPAAPAAPPPPAAPPLPLVPGASDPANQPVQFPADAPVTPASAGPGFVSAHGQVGNSSDVRVTPPKKPGLPSWAWWLIGGGGLAIVAAAIVVALVLWNAASPVVEANPTPTPTETSSEPAPTAIVIGLDELTEFGSVELTAKPGTDWAAVAADQEYKQSWKNSETGCTATLTTQTGIQAGDPDKTVGDADATQSVVDGNNVAYQQSIAGSTLAPDGEPVTIRTSDDEAVEFAVSRIDYTSPTADEPAFWLYASRVFVTDKVFLQVSLNCLNSHVDSPEDAFQDIIDSVTITL